MGDVWASARRDKMASRWACPRARTSWSRERGQAAAPTRKWRTTARTTRRQFVDVVQPEAPVDDFFQRKGQVFLWLSLCQSTGEKLDLLGQWTLKKRLAGATSEPIPSCPSCACDWEHLHVAALPGSCPAMGYMHFSCSHLCHLSLPLFLDSLINNGGFV